MRHYSLNCKKKKKKTTTKKRSHGATRGKVRGWPKSWGFILWKPWMPALNSLIDQNANIAIQATVLAWLKMTYGKEFGTCRSKWTFWNVTFVGLKATKVSFPSVGVPYKIALVCKYVMNTDKRSLHLPFSFSSGVDVMQGKSKRSAL